MLSWEPNVTASNAVAHALHSLFLALQGAVHQQAAAAAGSGAAAAGGAPVAVNPTKLREALAALPGQAEMQLGERRPTGAPVAALRLCSLPGAPCAGRLPPTALRPRALPWPAPTRAGEMSDAGETLLLMFEKVREASPATAAALDDLFGLHEREAVVCTDPRCGKTSHQNAYVQYFFNTRVGVHYGERLRAEAREWAPSTVCFGCAHCAAPPLARCRRRRCVGPWRRRRRTARRGGWGPRPWARACARLRSMCTSRVTPTTVGAACCWGGRAAGQQHACARRSGWSVRQCTVPLRCRSSPCPPARRSRALEQAAAARPSQCRRS